eukprot:g42409.t1
MCRRCVNARFISRAHNIAQNVTQAQCNAIHILNTNRNIVIKPVDKGGVIVTQSRMDCCKEVNQKLNNQEHYRPLPADPTKKPHCTHGPVNRNILATMDILALYTSIPHDDGIAATASILNTNNCQFPDVILQLIHFILNHNVFTFDCQLFIQTHGTAMGNKSAPQYANIFMH